MNGIKFQLYRTMKSLVYMVQNPGIITVYLVIVLWFGSNWLKPGIPAGDLPGTAAGLQQWKNLLSEGNLFSTWNNAWFCGHSRALFNLNGGMEIAYLPFLPFAEPLQAVKTGALAYIALSAFSCYLLLNYLINNKPVAWLLGLVYALHPIHISVTAASSHANFPPYYFLQPLLLRELFRLIDNPDKYRTALLSLLIALTAWVDFERLAVATPYLAIIFTALVLWKCCRKTISKAELKSILKKNLTAITISVVLAIALLGVFVLPAACEKHLHALFSESVRASSVDFFSIQNPLYYLDRDAEFLSKAYPCLPAENAHDAGTFYLGCSLLVLVLLTFSFPSTTPRENIILTAVLLAAAAALAAAHGRFSAYHSVCKILDKIFLYSKPREDAANQLLRFSLITITIFITLAVFSIRQMCRYKIKIIFPIIICTILLVIFAFTTPFSFIFSRFPPFAEMRNPGWFATAIPSIGLIIAAAIAVKRIIANIRNRRRQCAFVAVIAVVILADIWPYRKGFQNTINDKAIRELQDIALIIDNDERQARFITRESYNPHADLLRAYSSSPAAFYWLNWMAPAHTSDFIFNHIYQNLHKPDTIDLALENASWANIRYIIYDIKQGPLPPKSSFLSKKFIGSFFALYENNTCRPLANILPENAIRNPDKLYRHTFSNSSHIIKSFAQTSPHRITVSVDSNHSCTLMLSQSWFPGWNATIDGKHVSVSRVQKAFIGVSLPAGCHKVIFHRCFKWYHHLGVGSTIISAIICLTIFLIPLYNIIFIPIIKFITNRIKIKLQKTYNE